MKIKTQAYQLHSILPPELCSSLNTFHYNVLIKTWKIRFIHCYHQKIDSRWTWKYLKLQLF